MPTKTQGFNRAINSRVQLLLLTGPKSLMPRPRQTLPLEPKTTTASRIKYLRTVTPAPRR